MKKEERSELLKSVNINNSKLKDIEEAIDVFPIYEAKIQAFVEGYDEILVNDIATISIKLNRLNLDSDKQEIGYPHNNTNIEMYEEKAAVLVLKDNKIVYNAILNLYQKESKYEFKHMVHVPGKHSFKFEVFPLTVKGLDYSDEFIFEVKSESENRKKLIKSIEERDNKLELKPSIFQNMINTLMPVNPEDEEEEEEEENNNEIKKPQDKKDISKTKENEEELEKPSIN